MKDTCLKCAVLDDFDMASGATLANLVSQVGSMNDYDL